MAEDTLFIEVKALGYETIKQVEDAVKRLKAEVKGTSLGTDEYIRKEQQLLQVQEKKLDLNKRLMSSQAQMMQSYFRSGEAIRSNIIAGQNLGRVLQDLPYGFIGIANNIEPLLVRPSGNSGRRRVMRVLQPQAKGRFSACIVL